MRAAHIDQVFVISLRVLYGDASIEEDDLLVSVLVRADEDIARVQIAVYEVVLEHHFAHRVDPIVAAALPAIIVLRATELCSPLEHGLAVDEGLDEGVL